MIMRNAARDWPHCASPSPPGSTNAALCTSVTRRFDLRAGARTHIASVATREASLARGDAVDDDAPLMRHGLHLYWLVCNLCGVPAECRVRVGAAHAFFLRVRTVSWMYTLYNSTIRYHGACPYASQVLYPVPILAINRFMPVFDFCFGMSRIKVVPPSSMIPFRRCYSLAL